MMMICWSTLISCDKCLNWGLYVLNDVRDEFSFHFLNKNAYNCTLWWRLCRHLWVLLCWNGLHESACSDVIATGSVAFIMMLIMGPIIVHIWLGPWRGLWWCSRFCKWGSQWGSSWDLWCCIHAVALNEGHNRVILWYWQWSLSDAYNYVETFYEVHNDAFIFAFCDMIWCICWSSSWGSL